MGLDWIGCEKIEDDAKYNQTGYFRGKIISYDPNIEALADFDCNDAYGEEVEDGWFMSDCQRKSVICAIKCVLDKPSNEIDWDGFDDYDDWKSTFQFAHDFLENNEHIHCWF